MNRRNASTLPEELVFSEILPKLPAKSLIRFKCVSKEWLDIITNGTSLKKAHVRHHTARNSARGRVSFIVHAIRHCGIRFDKLFLVSGDNPKPQTNVNPLAVQEFDMTYLQSESLTLDGIEVFGSSNGLVLYSKPLTWWNPVTRESRVLPEAPLPNDEPTRTKVMYMDLGLDEESGDHKIVRVSENLSVCALNFQVFSKKADSWKELKTVSGFQIYGCVRPSVRIDGVSYFLARQPNSTFGSGNVVILSFTHRNLELRKVINVPDYYSPDGRSRFWSDAKLVRWKKDSLALVVTRASESPRVYDLWGMVKNGDGGDGFSWSSHFVFNRCPYVLGFWDDKYLIIGGSSYGSRELVLWDPQEDIDEEERLKIVNQPEFSWRFGVMNSDYIPTLISVFPDP